MPLPFFFEENLSAQPALILSEETSKHVIQVLRMQKGEKLQLTNGKGKMITVEIISDNKRAAEVKVIFNSTQRTSCDGYHYCHFAHKE